MPVVNTDKPNIGDSIQAATENARLNTFITQLDSANIAHEGLERRNMAGLTQIVTHKSAFSRLAAPPMWATVAQIVAGAIVFPVDARHNMTGLNLTWSTPVDLIEGDLVRIYFDGWISEYTHIGDADGPGMWIAQPYWDIGGFGVFSLLPGHSPHGSGFSAAFPAVDAEFYQLHEGIALALGVSYWVNRDSSVPTYTLVEPDYGHFMLSYDFIVPSNVTLHGMQMKFSGTYFPYWYPAPQSETHLRVAPGWCSKIALKEAKFSVMVLRS
jgi:hypothetical protein